MMSVIVDQIHAPPTSPVLESSAHSRKCGQMLDDQIGRQAFGGKSCESCQSIFQIVDEMLQREEFHRVGSFADIEETISRTRGDAVAYIEKEVMK